MTRIVQPTLASRALTVAGAVLLAVLVATGAWSSPQGGGGLDPLRGPVVFATSFDRLWLRYQEAERQGDSESVTRLLDEIRRLRLERNAFHLHDVALGFAQQGNVFLARGDVDSARRNFEVARELDPALPQAYHGLAQVARRGGGLGGILPLGNVASAYIAQFRSPASGAYATADLLLKVALSLFLVAALFSALMLYRHGVLIHHDLAERLDERFGRTVTGMVTGIVILLPLLLTFGVGWLFAFWLILTFAYQSKAERVLSISSLALLFLIGPLAALHTGWSRTLANPWFQASVSSVEGTFSPSDVFVLAGAVAVHPDDRDLSFLLATQYRNLGEYDRAASIYRSILARTPGDLGALINLGNIYFAQRDWEGALVQYNTAIERHPESALAYYNKSLAHSENFQFREKEEARTRADQVDDGTIRAHEALVEDAVVVIDARMSQRDILGKFFGLETDCHREPVSVFSPTALAAGPGPHFLVGALVLAGLLLLSELALAERRGTQRCWKCDSAFCARCQIGTGRKGLCTQCYHMYIVKDGVSAAARNEKKIQVREVSRLRSRAFRVLSLLVPGAGHVMEDMPLLGIGLLFVWVSGWVLLLFGSRFYTLGDPMLGLPGSTLQYVTVLALLVALVLANTVARPVPRG